MIKDKPRLFIRGNDTSWSFYFYDENGKRIFRKTDFEKNGEKKKCERYAKDYIKKYLEGEFSKPSLKKYVEKRNFFVWGKCKWIESKNRHGKRFSKVMARSRLGHLDNYILPKFGNIQLNKFTAGKTDDWLVSIPRANQTVNHIRNTLRIVFDQAKKDGLINDNPMLDVERMADKFEERLPFTLEETRLLFPKDEDELFKIWKDYFWSSMFHLMLTTGIRSGEIRALQWKHIFWDRREILIEKAVKREGVIGETKGKGKRAAWLFSRTLDLLQKWHERSRPYEDAESLIYHGFLNDNILSTNAVCKEFKEGLAKSDIEPRGRTPHCLRHTYNTLMLSAKIPLELIQFMVGHKDNRMTERYTHIGPIERLEQYKPMRQLADEVWE